MFQINHANTFGFSFSVNRLGIKYSIEFLVLLFDLIICIVNPSFNPANNPLKAD